MSLKAKALIYDQEKPKFLQQLQSGFGNQDLIRNNNPRIRSRKSPAPNNDNGPTYLLEESNEHISRSEYEAMLRKGEISASAGLFSNKKGNPKTQKGGSRRDMEKDDETIPCTADTKVGFRSSNKRKMGRMPGSISNLIADELDAETTRGKAVKDKTKRIKLSFDEES